jgi:hydrogenase nickel incorporation protein HypB
MCDTCGCSDHDHFSLSRPLSEDRLLYEHNHNHQDDANPRSIQLEKDILSKNNLLAERNRGYFHAKHIKVFNLVSSPGSGKTTLLEILIKELSESKKIYVIEGDQQTNEDANRIQKTGADVIQINTGSGCHLDAHMVNHAVNELNPVEGSILFIENVGNLVCPALFDLGEQVRVVVASTTEGEDKPLKYAAMFQSSHICVLNKMDLHPHLEFSLEKFRSNLDMVNPGMPLIAISAKTGIGLTELYQIILQ